jgi:hypothetical protein
MPNRLVSIYLAEMQERIEPPYRARQIIFDFSMSCALAFAIGFTLLVL